MRSVRSILIITFLLAIVLALASCNKVKDEIDYWTGDELGDSSSYGSDYWDDDGYPVDMDGDGFVDGVAMSEYYSVSELAALYASLGVTPQSGAEATDLDPDTGTTQDTLGFTFVEEETAVGGTLVETDWAMAKMGTLHFDWRKLVWDKYSRSFELEFGERRNYPSGYFDSLSKVASLDVASVTDKGDAIAPTPTPEFKPDPEPVLTEIAFKVLNVKDSATIEIEYSDNYVTLDNGTLVIDPDTKHSEFVHLYGIDASNTEIFDLAKRDKLSAEALKYVKAVLKGKSVKLEYVGTPRLETGTYKGELVANIWFDGKLQNEKLLNRELVVEGYATVVQNTTSNNPYRLPLSLVEVESKKARSGRWANEYGIIVDDKYSLCGYVSIVVENERVLDDKLGAIGGVYVDLIGAWVDNIELDTDGLIDTSVNSRVYVAEGYVAGVSVNLTRLIVKLDEYKRSREVPIWTPAETKFLEAENNPFLLLSKTRSPGTVRLRFSLETGSLAQRDKQRIEFDVYLSAESISSVQAMIHGTMAGYMPGRAKELCYEWYGDDIDALSALVPTAAGTLKALVDSDTAVGTSDKSLLSEEKFLVALLAYNELDRLNRAAYEGRELSKAESDLYAKYVKAKDVTRKDNAAFEALLLQAVSEHHDIELLLGSIKEFLDKGASGVATQTITDSYFGTYAESLLGLFITDLVNEPLKNDFDYAPVMATVRDNLLALEQSAKDSLAEQEKQCKEQEAAAKAEAEAIAKAEAEAAKAEADAKAKASASPKASATPTLTAITSLKSSAN